MSSRMLEPTIRITRAIRYDRNTVKSLINIVSLNALFMQNLPRWRIKPNNPPTINPEIIKPKDILPAAVSILTPSFFLT
jgi:hypothetical protein